MGGVGVGWGRYERGRPCHWLYQSLSLTFRSVIVINVRIFLLLFLTSFGFKDGGKVLS